MLKLETFTRNLHIVPSTPWNQTFPEYSTFLRNIPKAVRFHFKTHQQHEEQIMEIPVFPKYPDLDGHYNPDYPEFEGETIYQDGAILHTWIKKIAFGTRLNKRYAKAIFLFKMTHNSIYFVFTDLKTTCSLLIWITTAIGHFCWLRERCFNLALRLCHQHHHFTNI